MTYREPAPHTSLDRKAVYGPFPLRLGLFAGGIVVFVVGLLLVVVGLDDATLSCTGSGRCTYRNSQWLKRKPRRFALRDLRSVEVRIEKGSKNKEFGVPHLHFQGRSARLKRVTVDEAQRFARELDKARERDGKAFELELQSSRFISLAGLGMFAFGVAMFVSSLRGIGRVRLQLRQGVLHATRTLMGIPLGRWTVDAHGVADVEVAWSRIRTFLHRAHHPGDTAGSLVLRLHDGSERAVTAGAFRGFHLHLRAERELRALLDLPPRTPERVDALASRASDFEPPPPMGGGWSAKLGTAWIGMCCGSLAGMALLGLLGLAAGLIRVDESISTTFVIAGAGGGAVLGIIVAQLLVRRAVTR